VLLEESFVGSGVFVGGDGDNLYLRQITLEFLEAG
jgi:hypothetical protein